MRFVNSLRIPVVATLRDSQNYVRAAGRGIGIYELPYHQASKDIRDFVGLIAWLEKWQPPQQEILRPAQIDEQDPAALPLH